ncbi:MAG: hypothetical protein PUC22_05790, partial [Turicibacter sp.]|nr:hypothetical protein [Turicibacter sp.]
LFTKTILFHIKNRIVESITFFVKIIDFIGILTHSTIRLQQVRKTIYLHQAISYYFKKMNLILFFIQLADIYSKITHLNWTSFLT